MLEGEHHLADDELRFVAVERRVERIDHSMVRLAPRLVGEAERLEVVDVVGDQGSSVLLGTGEHELVLDVAVTGGVLGLGGPDDVEASAAKLDGYLEWPELVEDELQAAAGPSRVRRTRSAISSFERMRSSTSAG